MAKTNQQDWQAVDDLSRREMRELAAKITPAQLTKAKELLHAHIDRIGGEFGENLAARWKAAVDALPSTAAFNKFSGITLDETAYYLKRAIDEA